MWPVSLFFLKEFIALYYWYIELFTRKILNIHSWIISCPDGITPNSGLTGPRILYIYVYIYIYIFNSLISVLHLITLIYKYLLLQVYLKGHIYNYFSTLGHPYSFSFFYLLNQLPTQFTIVARTSDYSCTPENRHTVIYIYIYVCVCVCVL